jgi:hypothetical protein
MIQDQSSVHRRYFIGGSDARIIMGDDEAALLRLWREKRGEIEPEDLSPSRQTNAPIISPTPVTCCASPRTNKRRYRLDRYAALPPHIRDPL